MLTGGPSDKSGKVSSPEMGPGLGLVSGVVIDSHFAERGRIGRLAAAVAQNPRNIGLGIDENTAIVLEFHEAGAEFRVIGSGAVYVLDGDGLTYSSLSEQRPEGILTVCGLLLHILGEGDQYNLEQRAPVPPAESG